MTLIKEPNLTQTELKSKTEQKLKTEPILTQTEPKSKTEQKLKKEPKLKKYSKHRRNYSNV